MGNVDLADQLRGVYRLDRWVRNPKWWWSMLFFSTGVLLRNDYHFYLRVNKDDGVTTKAKGLILHYEFRKTITFYWINDNEALKIYKYGAAAAVASAFLPPTYISSVLFSDGDFTISSSIGTSSGSKAARWNDITLAQTGALRCQLDRSFPHMPVLSTTSSARCAIHRWLGFRKQGAILYCPNFNINICAGCYLPFHQCADLIGMKSYLIKKIKVEEDGPIAKKGSIAKKRWMR